MGSRILHHQEMSPRSVRTCFLLFWAEFGNRYCVWERAKREIVALILGSALWNTLNRCWINVVAIVRSVDWRLPEAFVKDESEEGRYPLLSALEIKNVRVEVLGVV